MLRFRSILILLSLLMLAACNGCSTTGGKLTPAQTVFQIETQYKAVLAVAVTYEELPRCTTPAVTKVCSDAGIVTKIRQANDVAKSALDAAQAAVRDPTFDDSATSAAIVSARQALLALTAIAAKLPTPKP